MDLSSPNAGDLLEALDEQGLEYRYIEIFEAPRSALAGLRRRFPSVPMETHGEGLWLTQPDLATT